AMAAAIGARQYGADAAVIGSAHAHSRSPETLETLSPRALTVLQHIGIPASIIHAQFPPVTERISRWGLGAGRSRPSVGSLLGGGHVLGKKLLVELLRQRAQDMGVRFYVAGRKAAAAPVGPTWHIALRIDTTNRPMQLEARFAIDASGRGAHLARSLGVRKRILDDLVAFWIRGPISELGRCSTAAVTVADGWLFFVGGGDGLGAIGYFTSAGRLRGKPRPADILAKLAAAPEVAIRMRGQADWALSSVVAQTASTTVLASPSGSNWLACGDALQTLDPLTSSGMLLALTQGSEAGHAAAANLRRMTGRTLTEYQERAAAQFSHYLLLRAKFYGLEAHPRAAGFSREQTPMGPS
ncbi:MAG: hypothetical protein EKK41_26850, partial [Hyphomicrobiales bacterium]